MSVSYKRLWKQLIDKDMKKQDLAKAAGISVSSVSKITRGDNVNIDILVRICNALNCNIEDIMEIVREK
jgi:DNA-binding Xre family transcriptional regulator